MILACVSLVACDSVKSYSQKALRLVGFDKKEDTQKSPRPARKQKSKTATSSQEKSKSPTAEKKKNEPAMASNIIISKTDENQARQVQKKDLKNVVKPEFRVEAPVDIQKRVGGVARQILSDDKFLYVDFPQHFAVYDHNLNFLARRKVAFAVRDVRHFTRDGKIYLYIKEENDVLEIMDLDVAEKDAQVHVSLKDVVSYDIGGDFFWTDEKTLVVLLEKQVQILDFTDFNDIRILNEISLGPVVDILSAGPILLLARGEFLDIFDTKQNKHISSVKIGKGFRFAGFTEQGLENKKQLRLALINAKGHLNALMQLRLSADLSQVLDFGAAQNLPKPLKDFYIDGQNELIIGKESGDKTSPLRLYSLDHKKFLRGELSTRTDLITWALLDGKLYLVTPLAISINKLALNPEVIAKSSELSRYLGQQTQQPLAQIGAEKILEDEYKIMPEKTIEFMADARRVLLLDENHFIVFENRATKGVQQILTTGDFMNDDFVLAEPKMEEKLNFDRVRTTDFGLLAYSQAKEKIYFMDVDFTSLSPLPLTIKEMVGWSVFATDTGPALVISSKNSPLSTMAPAPAAPATTTTQTAKGKKTPPKPTPAPATTIANNYMIEFYQLKSPTEVTLARQMPFADRPFVFVTGSGDLLILVKDQLEILSLNPADKFSTTEFDKLKFEQSYDIIDARLSPMSDRIYALIQQDGRYKILVQSTASAKQHVILEDFELTPEHFQGATFSKGGQLFILPTPEGTLFYDMSDLSDKDEDARIVAHWPEPAWWVDVAKGGRYVCVALGPKGVYCGELLFY